MKRYRYIKIIIATIAIFYLGHEVARWNQKKGESATCSVKDYKHKIEHNELMNTVNSMARAVVATGFSAGDGYGEVWIRDFNTFIELSMEVLDEELIRKNLNTFFAYHSLPLRGVMYSGEWGFHDNIGSFRRYFSQIPR